MMVAVAPVPRQASSTVLNTGTPWTSPPPPAGGHPTHHPGAILQHPLGVKATLPPGDALDQDQALAINQDAHGRPPAAATAFLAASARSWTKMRWRPEASRICLPSPTLVPARRTTTGKLMAMAL